jgi:hypothetical protein
MGLTLAEHRYTAERGDRPAFIFTVDDGGIDDIVAELTDKASPIVTPVSEAPGV